MKISVMIAAKNEADRIADCLLSVGFADEVIVVDDNSNDATSAIAEQHGAKVFHRKLDGFATQKNYGIDHASNNWVLILDADERVTPELATEITNLKPATTTRAFSVPFRNFLGDKWLRWGGMYPDRHTRLIDKRYAHYGTREVHEMLEVDGDTGELKGDIIHLTYANYREYLDKVVKYARLEADYTEHRPRYRHAFKVFLGRFITQQGFRDGFAGLMSAGLLGYYQIVIRRSMP